MFGLVALVLVVFTLLLMATVITVTAIFTIACEQRTHEHEPEHWFDKKESY